MTTALDLFPVGEIAIPEDLAHLDVAGLRDELARCLAMTAESLTRLALVVRLLEEKGEDLSDLRLGLLDQLRKIAHGQVMPEVLIRFGQNASLMRKVASLPLPDQAKLSAGEPVTLAVRRYGGAFATRRADPSRMLPEQIKQVFGPNGIRDEAEQILYLEGQPIPTAGAPAPRVGPIVADRRRGALKIGERYYPAAKVVDALAALRHEDAGADEEASAKLTIGLTPTQMERLRRAALDGKKSPQELARRALIAYGLI